LFGCWGVTTIFLFWAAMIKATRNWGGKMSQGKAFGILDGGRGLVAAGVASIAVILFSNLLNRNEDNISSPERVAAFKVIIYMYTSLTIGTALLVWLIIPETKKMISATRDNIFDHDHLLSGLVVFNS